MRLNSVQHNFLNNEAFLGAVSSGPRIVHIFVPTAAVRWLTDQHGRHMEVTNNTIGEKNISKNM